MSEYTSLLHQRAHKFIPGGAHTYSKGDDQFPSIAPKLIERGKGCTVWDSEGNQFLDFAMSLGCVVLGHAYEPVLEAVRKEIDKGVNFCRPSVIEGELAEIICNIIPSAEMVKFGKHGSDAVTSAIKLARAYTGKKYVARCSNDAFNAIHDWFIGSTVVNRGVPKEVQDLTLQFRYNDLKSCENLFENYKGQIACFILEPLSSLEPEDDFLNKLKDLCEANGTLLIFDEVVSGFRFSLGGAQEKINVTPHLSAFGKAMANGFSISALVGQKEFMNLGGFRHDEERVFLLSTTHGGETHCFAAAIKSIQEIIKHNAIDHFWSIGKKFQDGCKSIISDLQLQEFIEITGFAVKPGIVFKDTEQFSSMALRTLFLQETIAKGLLIPYVVPSLAHDESTLNIALKIIHESLYKIKNDIYNDNVLKSIKGDIVKPVFRKYN